MFLHRLYKNSELPDRFSLEPAAAVYSCHIISPIELLNFMQIV